MGVRSVSSVAQSCPTLCNPMDSSMPDSSVLQLPQSLLRLVLIESVMPSSHLILCRPLLFLPSIFPSIRVISKESVLLIRWPNYWSFSTSVLAMNIQNWFPLEWTDLILQAKGLKSLLQHHSSKASILQHSAFIIVQLSTCIHDYWKNHSFGLDGPLLAK